jgi:hypothetical protein
MRLAISGRSQAAAESGCAAAAEDDDLRIQLASLEMLGVRSSKRAQFQAWRRPRRRPAGCVRLFPVHGDPARAIAGDGLRIGFVGVEFHG